MFKPEITSHAKHGVPAQSIDIPGHGTYDARTDTLELVTEHLAHYSVRELRSRMIRAYHAFEGDSANPMLAGLRRAELLFIAAEYPSLYLPGMVQALGLKCDQEGRYWVPPTPEADAPASPFVADPENPTDAELAAAVERGIASGQIITVDEFLARAEQAKAIDRAHTVTHSNGITQVFATAQPFRAAGESSIGAYQREGASYRTYAPDGSSLGVWATEVSAYRAIVRTVSQAAQEPYDATIPHDGGDDASYQSWRAQQAAKPAPVTSRDIGSRGYFQGLSVVVEDVSTAGPYPRAMVRYVATSRTEWIAADAVRLA